MFGLYIHWPFCLSKCIYCDFGSKVITNRQNSNDFQRQYINNCTKQMQQIAAKITPNEPISSIYFGGGTPSLIDAKNIQQIITTADKLVKLTDNCEITIEANPTSCSLQKFQELKNIGINRISIGVQSFDDKELAFLGRRHSVAEAIQTIENAKKVFNKWSIDLIYALPKQTLSQWIENLKTALQSNPTHLSLYTLIVEPNTPLGKLVEIGNITPKTDDEIADFYLATNEFIAKNSKLKQYEVSNYAIDGFESRHNLSYWQSYDYIGIGAGAHGRLRYKNGKRYETHCFFNPNDWSKNIQQNGNGFEIEKELTTQEQIEEILLMGLRTKFGINFRDIKQRFNIDLMSFLDEKKLSSFQKKKLLKCSKHNITLTPKGLMILDSILIKISR